MAMISKKASRPTGEVGRAAGRVSRIEIGLLLLILLTGLVLRGLYLGELRRAPNLDFPPVDEGFTLYWAGALATGDWTLPPDAGGRDPEIRTRSYLRPPGYAFVLAAIHRVVGGDAVGIRAVQMGMGLVNLCLVWWLGRRIMGKWVGLVWAALLVLSWPILYFEGCLSASWLLIGLILTLLLALRQLAIRPSAKVGAMAGGVIGLTALVRPNALLFAPMLLLWGYWVLRRRGDVGHFPRIAGAATVAGLLVLAPCLVRNWSLEGRLAVSASGGLVLSHSNNDDATGASTSRVGALGILSSPWDVPDVIGRVERREGRRLTFAETSSILGRDAIRWMKENPKRMLGLVGRRTALFWGPEEVAHNRVVAVDWENSPLLRRLPVAFHVAVGGFLVGVVVLVFGYRQRDAESQPPGAMETMVAGGLLTLIWWLSFLPFSMASLYRVPIMPILLFPAAALLVKIAGLVRARRPTAALWIIALVGAIFLASLPIVSVQTGRGRWLYDRGLALSYAGDRRGAMDYFREALGEDPNLWPAHNGIGKYLLEAGDLTAATDHFGLAASLSPKDPVSRANLGLAHALAAHWEEAEAEFAAAVAWGPRNAEAWVNLGVCRENLGRLAEAVPAYESALRLVPGHTKAANNLAWLLATAPEDKLRNGARAVELARRLVASSPDASHFDTLAAALAETGRFAEAVATAESALERRGGPHSPPASEIGARLDGYRLGRPYRQPSR